MTALKIVVVVVVSFIVSLVACLIFGYIARHSAPPGGDR